MIRFLYTGLFFILAWPLAAQQVESPSSGNYSTTVALVFDRETLARTRPEAEAYKRSLEARGLGAYIVSHDWQRPEEIRSMLKTLYGRKPALEGAVLIGNIPIAMVRDAQHLTSTFKMDQRVRWERSSVPSDRFYDDFDLQFDFLKQDSLHRSYFYYSLSPASPQRLTPDIYTGRVKPPVIAGKDGVEQIRAFLVKAARVGPAQNKLDQLLVYTGYGYNSESLNAWGGEQLALREQFPALFRPGSQPMFMNFRMAPYMKFNLLSEVQRDGLDLAIFHGHGDEETQLINGYPTVSNPGPSIENIRRYLRSKLQAAHTKKQDVDALKKRFTESLGVPMAWMDDALADSVVRADSLFDANTNIAIADVAAIRPNARMVILDACDNGEFHQDQYIAGYYAFGEGNTMVALANSVGVLQDQWPGEMLGLLQHGVRVGNWFRQVAYLETHLIGDPTYAFTGGTDHGDLNRRMAGENQKASYWRRLLREADPDLQSLALARLTALAGAAASPLLKKTYYEAPWGTTRMEALKQLCSLNNADYLDVLPMAVNDPYEFIRRQAAGMIADNGSDTLLPALVHVAIADRHSKRVAYRVRNALSFMNSGQVLAALRRQASQYTYRIDSAAVFGELIAAQEATVKKVAENFEGLAALPAKEKTFNIRSLRVYTYHTAVPAVIQLIENKQEDEKLRLAALEALSWFTHSYQRPAIEALCGRLQADAASSDALRREATRTANILATGHGR